MDGYIGEIRLFTGNFAPRGWALCDGQLIAISQNTSLFSIIGTTYGGDGRTSMALPDMRGRTAIHPGTGPGLSTRKLGERFGTETNTMTLLNMAAHSHIAQATLDNTSVAIPASNNPGNKKKPGGNNLAADVTDATYTDAAPDVTLGTPASVAGNIDVTVNTTGGQQPINNMQPVLAVNYIICMFGIYPSRS